jgi:hypothetical protein
LYKEENVSEMDSTSFFRSVVYELIPLAGTLGRFTVTSIKVIPPREKTVKGFM